MNVTFICLVWNLSTKYVPWRQSTADVWRYWQQCTNYVKIISHILPWHRWKRTKQETPKWFIRFGVVGWVRASSNRLFLFLIKLGLKKTSENFFGIHWFLFVKNLPFIYSSWLWSKSSQYGQPYRIIWTSIFWYNCWNNITDFKNPQPSHR